MEGVFLQEHTVSYVTSVGPALVPAGVHLSRLGAGEENGARQLFCLREVSQKDPCLSSIHSLVSKSPFSHCCFCALSQWGCLLYCLFKGRDSTLLALSAEPTEF